jgi:Protein of unknown function (DUF3108)
MRDAGIFCAIAPLILGLVAVLAAPMLAAGEAIAPKHVKRPKAKPTPNVLPANIQAQVPVYTPGPMPYHEGEQFVFEASWIGIPAAQARFQLHTSKKDDSMWIGEGWVQTNGFADLFFMMRDHVKEEIAKPSLMPSQMVIDQHENKRIDQYTVTFNRPDRLVTITKHNHKGDFSRQFISTNGLGMISGGLMALSQPLEAGKTYNFDIFSGTERYVFSFDVAEREHVHLPLGEFDAWRIVPDVLYWSDGNLKGEGRDTTLWISADSRRLPLRIQSATFIGYVRADLIEVDDGKVIRAQ